MNESDNDLEIQEEEEEEEAKCKQRSRGKKRKRVASESSTDIEDVLPENTLEVEKNLHASAIKNNLDDISVKKILKKVVTNDHVLALVKLREEEEDSSTEENLQPKITRAKAKQLMKVSPKSAPWNLELTPIKHIPVKTRPEVKALIAQELPDDEDDDEYEPTHDDVPSDDDHTLESSSDVDSLPRTPATPRSQKKATPSVVKDGPFKVPQQEVSTPVRRKLVLEEEATIALRTRSKLSLSATSIEHIESSFVPPDDLPMPDVDSLWNDFLTDCLNPASNTRHEDDDEADPEYNVAADPDANEEDEESLENSIIKISKKELNDLVTELFSIMPDSGPEQAESIVADHIVQDMLADHTPLQTNVPTRWEGKQEPESEEDNTTVAPRAAPVATKKERFSIGKSEPQDSQEHLGDDESHPTDQMEQEPMTTDDSTPLVIANASNPSTISSASAPAVYAVATAPTVYEVASNPTVYAVASTPTVYAVGSVPTVYAVASGPTVYAVRSAPISYAVAPAPPVLLATKSSAQKSEKQPPSLLRNVLAPKPQPIRVEIQKDSCNVLPEQVVLLQQQLRMHVQLAASNYLQLFVHPAHWARAPVYKEYLVSLGKMVEKLPTSVVNVCNLKPALELIASWEDTVSENTKENMEMVKFIENEQERIRRRSSHNGYVCGEFPPMFLQVVANSPVFLYPHLLPAAPFRPNNSGRRCTYLKPEDDLIALGLDQFWEYVSSNPEIYKRPKVVHPRHRWGLAATLQLICKHMLPWLPPKTLLSHVSKVKKGTDTENAIYKYFETGKVDPVKHKLLQFNPQLTLYEQPEHEVPRVWIRYLAKSSSRFKKFLFNRNKVTEGPSGVDIDVNVQAPTKTPLPIDFNKKINCNRLNLLPKDEVPTVNRIDVAIDKGTASQPLVVSEVFTVVNTSTGAILVPLQENNENSTDYSQEVVAENPPTVDDIAGSNDVEGTKTAERSNPTNDIHDTLRVVNNENSEHCSCCIVIRKICKQRQKAITDYFKRANDLNASSSCRCKGRRYPRITNRLKLLLKIYKTHSKSVFEDLMYKINMASKEDSEEKFNDTLIIDDREDDLETAALFHLKLTTITAIIRNNLTKKRIHKLLSTFDVHVGNVLVLAGDLGRQCEEELIQYYKEFVGFLTAEQADEIGQFKDYFTNRCMVNLIKKVEELVPDKQNQCTILRFLKSKFFTTVLQSWSACDICTELLRAVERYPPLADYVFSLFPHRRVHSEQQDNVDQQEPDSVSAETPADTIQAPAVADAAMESEADNSSSDEGEDDNGNENTKAVVDKTTQFVNEHESTLVKVEEDEIIDHNESCEMSNDASDIMDTQTETSNDATDMSRLVMSEDETLVKSECPEWKRDEDKLILEVLKDHITPEERRDKTILEILEDTRAVALISDSLQHKSILDVKQRILYLLQLLVSSGQ